MQKVTLKSGIAGIFVGAICTFASIHAQAVDTSFSVEKLATLLSFNPFLATTTANSNGEAFLFQPAQITGAFTSYTETQPYYFLEFLSQVPLTPLQQAAINNFPLNIKVEPNTPDSNSVTVLVPTRVSFGPASGIAPAPYVPSGPLGAVTNPFVVQQNTIPAAVLATFQGEANGESLDYINHYFDHGKEIYQVNIPYAPGIVKMVQVGPDGKELLTGYFTTDGREVFPNIVITPVVFYNQPLQMTQSVPAP